MTKTKVGVKRRVFRLFTHNLKHKLFFAFFSAIVFSGLTLGMQFNDKKAEPKKENLVIQPATKEVVRLDRVGFTEPVITIQVSESPAEKEKREQEEKAKLALAKAPRREVISRSVSDRIEVTSYGDAQEIGRRKVAEVWGEGQWPAFHAIIQKESGWVVGNKNRRSGACGLGQALPCSKLGSAYGNPEGEVNWVIGYISARYQTPERALAFHRAHGWY